MDQKRWEGKSTAELKQASADQIWPLLADFCNLHKWLPLVDTCYQLDGGDGVIRYCSSTSSTGGGETKVNWAKEKLLLMDHERKCLSYEVTENNIGLRSYVATIQVVPLREGCRMEWLFASDPVEGWSYEGLSSYVELALQNMAKTMEAACVPAR